MDLFGKVTIKSISFNEQEIIQNILDLHCGGQAIECDPTYSIGNFYKGRTKPKYKFDINPQIKGVIEASADKLPLPDESINVLMFDPPFLAGKDVTNTGIMRDRFNSFYDMKELWEFYNASLKEFQRVLACDGTLIFKNQDTVSGGKNYFSHVEIMIQAVRNGFYPKDMFVLLAKNRIEDVLPENQQHARKYHCYFWVFKKQSNKVRYAL